MKFTSYFRTLVLIAFVLLLQMVSRATLAFVAASLVAVASAAAPDINVVVGNFALNLVSKLCASLLSALLYKHGSQSSPKMCQPESSRQEPSQ